MPYYLSERSSPMGEGGTGTLVPKRCRRRDGCRKQARSPTTLPGNPFGLLQFRFVSAGSIPENYRIIEFNLGTTIFSFNDTESNELIAVAVLKALRVGVTAPVAAPVAAAVSTLAPAQSAWS